MESLDKNAIKNILETKLNPETRQLKILNLMCSNSGACTAFGTYIDQINILFENMNFKYLINPIKRIGAPSANGFINEFIFEKNGYKAYSILKSSQNRNSDNLLYEYYVGVNFINKYIKKLPCFLETYNIYVYGKPITYTKLKENKTNTIDIVQNFGLLKIDKINRSILNQSCKDSTKIAILIQHMENPISFFQTLNFETIYEQNIGLLLNLLQIYLPLNSLKNKFTHNDLHVNNVLLYKIPNNNYIQLTYVLPDNREITFNTYYILKIIDYGRSFFYENNDINSVNFYKQLDAIKDCDEEAQYKNGYGFRENELNEDNFYISSIVNNISKDLWLLQNVNYFAKFNDTPGRLDNTTPISKSLQFNILNTLTDVPYGGPPVSDKDCEYDVDEETEKNPCNINIVTDKLTKIFMRFKKEIDNGQKDYFKKSTKIANMKVYLDLSKDMEYEPTHVEPSYVEPSAPPFDLYEPMDISPVEPSAPPFDLYEPMDISPVEPSAPPFDSYEPMDIGGSKKKKKRTHKKKHNLKKSKKINKKSKKTSKKKHSK
jgi:hypothetical protein